MSAAVAISVGVLLSLGNELGRLAAGLMTTFVPADPFVGLVIGMEIVIVGIWIVSSVLKGITGVHRMYTHARETDIARSRVNRHFILVKCDSFIKL